jgi:hypothetical protein
MLFASFYLLFGLTALHGVTMEMLPLIAALMPRAVVFEVCAQPVVDLAKRGHRKPTKRTYRA